MYNINVFIKKNADKTRISKMYEKICIGGGGGVWNCRVAKFPSFLENEYFLKIKVIKLTPCDVILMPLGNSI